MTDSIQHSGDLPAHPTNVKVVLHISIGFLVTEIVLLASAFQTLKLLGAYFGARPNP